MAAMSHVVTVVCESSSIHATVFWGREENDGQRFEMEEKIEKI